MLTRFLMLLPFYYRFATARNVRRVMRTTDFGPKCAHCGFPAGFGICDACFSDQ